MQRVSEAIAADYIPPATGVHSLIADAPLVQELLQYVRDGNYLETAAQAAGLSKVTVYSWLKRGEAGEEPFKTFMNAFEKAQAQSELEDVKNVRKAGQKEQFWAASMTHLERRFPERYGKRSEDGNTPKVIVQIGVQATDVSVTFAQPQVNVIDTYQTHSLGEGQSAQALPAPYLGAIEAKGEGRKSLTPQLEPALALPAASPGHGLTEPAALGGGVAPDGSGVLKASRRRGRKEKKA